MKRFRLLAGLAIVALVVVGVVAAGLTHRSVYRTLQDPTGAYTAIVTYRTVYAFIPMAIGSSSDKPGFVEIQGAGGERYGEMPVDMLQNAEVIWTEGGARITLVGSWDFREHRCSYWAPDDTHQLDCSR